MADRTKSEGFMLRMPDGMRDALKSEAERNGRSLSAEICHRLEASGGLTLRDWFAGQVMPAVIAATSAGQHSPEFRHDDMSAVLPMARDAYALADAMLAAREVKS